MNILFSKQVVGCFFAWQTRYVNIPALNDSKYIGMSVYNVVIISSSAVAISYVIAEQQDYSSLINGLMVIMCTTITLCLVFVPKVCLLRGRIHPKIQPTTFCRIEHTSDKNHPKTQ